MQNRQNKQKSGCKAAARGAQRSRTGSDDLGTSSFFYRTRVSRMSLPILHQYASVSWFLLLNIVLILFLFSMVLILFLIHSEENLVFRVEVAKNCSMMIQTSLNAHRGNKEGLVDWRDVSISQPLVSAFHTAVWPICALTSPDFLHNGVSRSRNTPHVALGECSGVISANLGFLSQIKPVHLHCLPRGCVSVCRKAPCPLSRQWMLQYVQCNRQGLKRFVAIFFCSECFLALLGGHCKRMS